MIRYTLDDIKAQKFFYRDNFRRTVKFIIVSLFWNLLMIGLLYFVVVTRKQPDFYATNSESMIVKLTPLDHPNKSDTPLLKADLPQEMFVKKLDS